MVFGKKCEFVEYKEMRHGWFTEGDRAKENIAVAAKETLNRAVKFLKQHVSHGMG